MSRNKPLAAQQPFPAFANDQSDFWGSVASENTTTGIGSLLPQGTLSQADNAVKSKLLDGQIAWVPVSVRWKGAVIQASLSDAQFFLALEEGGDTQQGRITLVVNKFRFGVNFPSYQDTVEVQAAGEWHQFVVAEMIGQNDDNEPSLTLYLEKDTDDNGN